MDKTKLLDLIRKLLNLGDKDRNSSEAEAELAASKAMELLQKHNLSISDVMIEDKKEGKSVNIVDEEAWTLNKSSLPSYIKDLARVAAFAAETQWFFNKKYRDHWGKQVTWSIHFYGTEWDVAVAKELFNFLYSKVTKMSKQYQESYQQRCFMEGFAWRLHQRLNEEKKNFEKEVAANENYAIVLADKKLAIKDYGVNVLKLRHSKGHARNGAHDQNAFAHGASEADKVDLGVKNRLNGG
jgi:hypothetical protein